MLLAPVLVPPQLKLVAMDPKPSLRARRGRLVVKHEKLGAYAIHFDRPDEIKFCENTNVTQTIRSEETGTFLQGTVSTIIWWGGHSTRRLA